MTPAGNYAVIIALAILIATGAALTYVLYVHFTTPTPTPQQTTTTITTPTTTPTAANTTTQPGPTPTASSRVLSVSLYVATPEVLKCAGLGGVYLYYFNVTVERARAEDPVTLYVFKAAAGNATYRLTDGLPDGA
jgi:cytoskeletal protein RodZ